LNLLSFLNDLPAIQVYIMRLFPTRLAYFAGLLFLTAACTDSTDQQAASSALRYQFHSAPGNGPKPAAGDQVTLHVKFTNSQDSVLQNTWESDAPARVTLQPPAYPASLEEAIFMLSVGDSATFYINADSVFAHTFRQPLPDEYIAPGTDIAFTLKLLEIRTPAQVRASRLAADAALLDDYAQQQAITGVQQLPSGLRYRITRPGSGNSPAPGDTLRIHYSGTFLDGTTFDDSYRRNEPLEIVFGEGSVIAGWEEGIALLKKGGKATLLIPSGLAYGASGLPDLIPPDANLVLEVELLDIR
jgi:FKBP-type peptidyl-prolyl cis-trans isomerase FkpA